MRVGQEIRASRLDARAQSVDRPPARAYTGGVNSQGASYVLGSYAKINLTLDVLDPRPDGFHNIRSVIQSIGLHDMITVTVGGDPGIRVTCDVPEIPTDERNLAHKAASVFFDHIGETPRVDIHIEKHVPVEAGLGGGSSNAAAVLKALGSAFSVGHSALADMAAGIGSDVPFFLVGGTALVGGRGDEVEELPEIPEQWLAIVKPPFGVSTAWAYKRLDEMEERPFLSAGELIVSTERMVRCVRTSDWACLPDLLSNDLELPAVEQHPEIGEIKQQLLSLGARGALMCGSGSAVFGIFASQEAAGKAREALSGGELRTFVCRTIGRSEMA